MREIDDLGLPNNDSRSHKRFGYASRRSTIHIASTREKTHLFGTTITSGRPNSLASLTISFFVKRNITWHWSSVNACKLNRGHARSYVTPLGKQIYHVVIVIFYGKLQQLLMICRHIHCGNLANTLRLNLATSRQKKTNH